MNTDKLSRRRLLSGLLASLTACLCPRPTQAAALPPHNRVSSTTYGYDATGRLLAVTDQPPHSKESPPRLRVTQDRGGTFIYAYDAGADRRRESSVS